MPQTQPFPPEALRDWLALLRAPLIGPKSYAVLLERFGNPQQFFQAGSREWRTAGIKSKTLEYLLNPDWERVDQDLRWLEAPHHHALAVQDPRYPPLLLEIADPPPLLFVVGNPDCLAAHHLAVVGSRNPSPGGIQIAREFSTHLSQAGLGIISGLALGIDAASHRGALDAKGVTVAVEGTGPDQVYPRIHRNLAEDIVAGNGALVSEFPPGTQPLAANFPKRNRIISGLSLGTLVVEATPRSGSLITARMAAEQGREVFAVPGSIYNPLSRGCHDLIKDGAKLVQDIKDILDELGAITPATALGTSSKGTQPAGNTEPHIQLLERMGHDPATIDALVSQTGEPADKITTLLVLLELEGHVASTPGGGYYRLR